MTHKIFLVLFFCIVVTLTASAQKITVSLQHVKLEKVFDAITQQTGLAVAYSRPTVNPDRIVSINADNEELSSVLSRLLTGSKITFEIGSYRCCKYNKQIFICRTYTYLCSRSDQQRTKI